MDDALIIARYAENLASGEGYRFNPGGEISDGVTPLGFAYLLAPFAKGGALSAWQAARALGALLWLSASAGLGIAIGRASTNPLRYLALLLVLTSAPLAAWSVAGMETGWALSLATLAVTLPSGPRSSLVAALSGGLLAWLRPEALPFAMILGLGRGYELSKTRERKATAYLQALALSALPFALVVLIRLIVFDRPVPLSVLAKPSGLSHGLHYALACALLTGGPVAAFAPLGWRKIGAFPRSLLLAALAHFVAVALAGGDWMPLSRLVVPALPALALAVAHLLSTTNPALALPRLALALAGTAFVFVQMGPSASRVVDSRLALIESARPALEGKERVAAVDIGWLGAATSAKIVDLAGVTELEIAALSGGHTTKAVSFTMLSRREIDALLVLLPPRGVEARLLADPAFSEEFEAVWRSPAALPLRYELWQRKSP